MDDRLPCLDLLAATPAIPRGLMSGISERGHIRQIAELVRTRKYSAGAGRLGKEYKLKP